MFKPWYKIQTKSPVFEHISIQNPDFKSFPTFLVQYSSHDLITKPRSLIVIFALVNLKKFLVSNKKIGLCLFMTWHLKSELMVPFSDV